MIYKIENVIILNKGGSKH